MVEITCPASKSGKIAGYVVGCIFGQFLDTPKVSWRHSAQLLFLAIIILFLLYRKIKGRYLGRTNDIGTKDIELEGEDKKIQQTFCNEKGGADTPDVGFLSFLAAALV